MKKTKMTGEIFIQCKLNKLNLDALIIYIF